MSVDDDFEFLHGYHSKAEKEDNRRLAVRAALKVICAWGSGSTASDRSPETVVHYLIAQLPQMADQIEEALKTSKT